MDGIIAIQVIIPTFNEKDNIEQIIKAIYSVIFKARIVIVDDSSPDGTANIVKNLKKTLPNLYLLSQKEKGGRGQAVLTGLKFVNKKFPNAIAVEMDADFSHRPQELTMLIKQVNQKTAVVASRYLQDSKIKNWPVQRKIFSFFSNQLLKYTLKLELSDYTNGYRAYPPQAVKELVKHKYVCSSYLVLSETALILKKAGFKITEIASVFPNRTKGKSNTNFKEIKHNLVELLKIRKKYFTHE